MEHKESGEQVYVCPMHPEVHQSNPGRCPKCRMDLVPKGVRFAMLRHMIKSPLLIVAMVIVMVAVMILMLR
jgi:Heavy metal binding domain